MPERLIDFRVESLFWPLRSEDFLANLFGKNFHVAHHGSSGLSLIELGLGSFEVSDLLKSWKPKKIFAWLDTYKDGHRVFPVEPSAALDYYLHGATLYFHINPHPLIDEWLARICIDLQIPVRGQISILATRSNGGIRPHFDANDNFTIQLHGSKRWDIAKNEQIPYPTQNWVPSGPIHDDLRASTTQPVEEIAPSNFSTVLLAPGSVLYLPRGFWHGTETIEGPSISLNVLCPPFTWVDLVMRQLRQRLLGLEPWRKSAYGILRSGAASTSGSVLELDLLINDLKLQVNGIEAMQFTLGHGEERERIAITNQSLITKCPLARWRIREMRGTRSVVVTMISSSGHETTKSVRHDLVDVLSWIATAGLQFRFKDLREENRHLDVSRLRRLVRVLWAAGFVNVA